MAVVLGIDAAWTARNASGVALARRGTEGWRLLGVWPSHADFVADPQPAPPVLLARGAAVAGAPVDLVAVDMPLSLRPITGYRQADRQVSVAYGARKAATHTPSALRPGAVSDRMREGFGRAGYRLRTASDAAGRLVEVYPHPALIELLRAEERLPYKVSRARKYWTGIPPAERVARLLDVWGGIVAGLEPHLSGTAALLPLPSPDAGTARLKRFEDSLDAVVCVVAGIAVLEGRAQAFGDGVAAIWVPLRTT